MRFGISRTQSDPRTGKRTRDRSKNASRMVVGKGQHVPLWDEATLRQIELEMSRRVTRAYRGRSANQLTSLLTCSTCGGRLRVTYNNYTSHMGHDQILWRCSDGGAAHGTYKHPDLLDGVSRLLQDYVLKGAEEAGSASAKYAGKLSELKARRERILDAYEAGALPLADYSARLQTIDGEIAAVEERAAAEEADQLQQAARDDAMRYLREHVNDIPRYIKSGPESEVNHLLRLIFEDVVVGDGLRARWKQ